MPLQRLAVPKSLQTPVRRGPGHLIQSQLFCEPALGNFVVGLTTMITHVSASVSLARLGPCS
jgi:hypothetical protein